MGNNISQSILFKQNEVIIEKGSKASFAYLINTGYVEVYLHEDEKIIPLAELGPGQIFGENSLFENSVYGANVKAMTDAKVTTISHKELKDMLNASNPVLRSLVLMMMDRLKKTNQALVKSETREFMDIGFI